MMPFNRYLVFILFAGQILQYWGQCPSFPSNYLGNDTLIPCGQTLQLTAPPSYSSYLWNTGSLQSSITVSQPGTYTVNANATLNNIIFNGDFSLGNVGFTSDYIYGTGGTWGLLSNEGQFAIAANANQTHNNFANCFNHTTGNASGAMLVVNGASTPNTAVWSQTINVEPNTNYEFSVWAASVVSTNPGILSFNINGVQVGNTFTLSTTLCNWQQFFSTWNSGLATTAVISIVNLNTQVAGNDFALDDISFRPVCTFTDQIAVTFPPNPTINVSPNTTICQGTSTDLTATSNAVNGVFNWNPGGLTGAQITVSPNQSTVYNVNVTDANNCTSSTVQTVVTVVPAPQLSISADTTICFGTSANLSVSSNLAVNEFNWNQGTHIGNQWIVAPTESTTYTVTANSTQNNCVSSASVNVNVIPAISIDIIGTPSFCSGSSTELFANSNTPNTDFSWQPMNSNQMSIVVDEDNAGEITLIGQIGDCPAVSTSIQVSVIPNPTISVSEDQTVCPGAFVNLNATSSNPQAVFIWNNGFSGASQNIQITENTSFTVYADFNGCLSESENVTISVSGACGLEVPNVFTPNGDGSNDFFELIAYEGIQTIELIIANRWGNLVYSSNIPNFSWDGKAQNGNPLEEGVYFYKIVARSISGEEYDLHGFVQLIRE
jgi:gliding motility-associated-like protein